MGAQENSEVKAGNYLTSFVINGCTFRVDKKYKPIGAIGQGSYGVVCSALNTETGEKVAIKKIKPMASDEWDATHTLREIRLMRYLGVHENIIGLVDLSICEERDELYVMMELVDTDLHRLIQSPTRLGDEHIQVILYQLLCGVKALHDSGILHRDLKPGNLLINKDCELKITDFGLARMTPGRKKNGEVVDPPKNPLMTEYVVTRWYRPPELMLAPSGVYTGAVDMWSVGCIFGELLNRKPLFPGNDFIDQLTRIFKVIPVPSKESRGYSVEGDALKFLESLSGSSSGTLDKTFKTASPSAIDMLQKLLCFNPKERMTVDDALLHPYLQNVRKEWGEVPSLKLPQSFEFAFEEKSLSLDMLRQFIRDEVIFFKKQEGSSSNIIKKIETNDERIKETESERKEEGNVEEKYHTPPSKNIQNSQNTTGFTVSGCSFRVDNKYEPIGVLGEGSYGIVCSARNKETQEKLAIKKICPMAGDDWDAKHTLREIRLIRHFGQHPNITSLKDLSACKEMNELYIMMELVDTDLHRLIQSPTVLHEEHIQAILFQILCGTKALHDNGVLHRDLKPGNVLINKNCEVKITDFGLARCTPGDGVINNLIDPMREDKHASLMTEYVVTRWYRAPELMLAPSGVYTASVDMWSIGCIFAELLIRKPLFPGNDFLDQLSRVFSLVPVPPISHRGYHIEGDALKFLDSLPKCSSQALGKAIKKISPEALSLLRRFLRFNPDKRISVDEALQHPYLRKAKHDWGKNIPSIKVNTAREFNFDSKKFSLMELKEMIFDEISLFKEPLQTCNKRNDEPTIPKSDGLNQSPVNKEETAQVLLQEPSNHPVERQESGKMDPLPKESPLFSKSKENNISRDNDVIEMDQFPESDTETPLSLIHISTSFEESPKINTPKASPLVNKQDLHNRMRHRIPGARPVTPTHAKELETMSAASQEDNEFDGVMDAIFHPPTKLELETSNSETVPVEQRAPSTFVRFQSPQHRSQSSREQQQPNSKSLGNRTKIGNNIPIPSLSKKTVRSSPPSSPTHNQENDHSQINENTDHSFPCHPHVGDDCDRTESPQGKNYIKGHGVPHEIKERGGNRAGIYETNCFSMNTSSSVKAKKQSSKSTSHNLPISSGHHITKDWEKKMDHQNRRTLYCNTESQKTHAHLPTSNSSGSTSSKESKRIVSRTTSVPISSHFSQTWQKR